MIVNVTEREVRLLKIEMDDRTWRYVADCLERYVKQLGIPDDHEHSISLNVAKAIRDGLGEVAHGE